jgi:hypothetical protein
MTAIKYMHHRPGRLRVKGWHFNCQGARARKAVAELEALPGVERVQLNAHAESLAVQYDPEMCGKEELLAVLDAAGCLNGTADLDVGSATGRLPFAKAWLVPSARRWSVRWRSERPRA